MHTGITPLIQGKHRDGDRGFTLVELLIVIVILGILATVTVFAVRGITDQGQQNAEAADLRTLESAVESYYGLNQTYPADQAALVAAELLSQESTLHEYTLNGDGTFTIANVANGGGGGGAPAPAANATAGTPITVAGIPMLEYGPPAASRPFYIVGGAVAGAQWDDAVNAGVTITGAYTFRFIDVADVPDAAAALDVRTAMVGNWGAQFSQIDDIANFDGTTSSLYETIEANPFPLSWVRFNPGTNSDVADIFVTA